MSSTLKLAWLAANGVLATAAVASAQTAKEQKPAANTTGAPTYQSQAVMGGKDVGSEPDPNIRGQLMRQYKQ
jgi:hypothetical protein